MNDISDEADGDWKRGMEVITETGWLPVLTEGVLLVLDAIFAGSRPGPVTQRNKSGRSVGCSAVFRISNPSRSLHHEAEQLSQ
jgi:hypothetical protein